MSIPSEIVKRLTRREETRPGGGSPLVNPDGPAAADLIERLTAERDAALRLEAEHWTHLTTVDQARVAAISRAEAAEAVLHRLANAADDVGVKHLDTDTPDETVAALQEATALARSHLAKLEEQPQTERDRIAAMHEWADKLRRPTMAEMEPGQRARAIWHDARRRGRPEGGTAEENEIYAWAAVEAALAQPQVGPRLTYEEAEKLALKAIHDDGRGMIGASRNHLHQRVARAILETHEAALAQPQAEKRHLTGEEAGLIQAALLASSEPLYDLAQPQAEGWRDIASAPKDGTAIDLWCVYRFKTESAGCRITDAYWDEDTNGWHFEGWHEKYRPTHWRPLPPPPEIQP